jgi:hypothetical protein
VYRISGLARVGTEKLTQAIMTRLEEIAPVPEEQEDVRAEVDAESGSGPA